MTSDLPLPTTLEDAIEELQKLRRILFNERLVLAKAIEKRELDRRSHKGELKTLREENDELRKQQQELRKRLERLVTKDTAF